MRTAARCMSALCRLAAIAGAASAAAGCASPRADGQAGSAHAVSPVQAIAPTQRSAQNLETFDAMWVAVRDSHWDPEAIGPKWDAVRDELRPRAESAADAAALRAVMMEALSRLGQSHFTIIPGEMSDAKPEDGGEGGVSGITLAVMPSEGGAPGWDAVVVAVEPGSPGAQAGIATGMRVLDIDGKPLAERLPAGDGLERHARAAAVGQRASREPGVTASWNVERAGEAPRRAVVTYARDPRPLVKFGSLPPIPAELNWRILPKDECAQLGAAGLKVGLVRFNIWLIPMAAAFDAAMDGLRGCDGIIIDLRGNPGGLGGMAMGIAGHFTPEPVSLGAMRSRDATLSFVTNPRRVSAAGEVVEPFAGPLAILLDGESGSTTEIFAGGLQHIGRARVFGSRSAGAALPAVTTSLPGGDVLLHAFADYTLPDGTHLEATGVRPDGAREYLRADYAREPDPALADAVRWVARERRPGERGTGSSGT